MAKLTKYANNLFATHATLDAAIEYAQTVANGDENPAAVMTAVQVVLNTAISMHHAELAAANRPLIEMIDARVAAAVADLRSDLDDQITEKLDELDIDSKIQDWMDNNFDAESALSGTSMRISFD